MLMLVNEDCYLLKFIIDIDTIPNIISITVSKKTLISYNVIITGKTCQLNKSICITTYLIMLKTIIEMIIKILKILIFVYLYGLYSLEISRLTINNQNVKLYIELEISIIAKVASSKVTGKHLKIDAIRWIENVQQPHAPILNLRQIKTARLKKT